MASCFDTAAEAGAYLDAQIRGKTADFGGSVTLDQPGLYETLSEYSNMIYPFCSRK